MGLSSLVLFVCLFGGAAGQLASQLNTFYIGKNLKKLNLFLTPLLHMILPGGSGTLKCAWSQLSSREIKLVKWYRNGKRLRQK